MTLHSCFQPASLTLHPALLHIEKLVSEFLISGFLTHLYSPSHIQDAQLLVTLVFAVGNFDIRLKRNFLWRKKGIFPFPLSAVFEEATFCKYWKAFCIRIQTTDTESLMSKKTKQKTNKKHRNLPYDCIKNTSKITHSITHEHKYT